MPDPARRGPYTGTVAATTRNVWSSTNHLTSLDFRLAQHPDDLLRLIALATHFPTSFPDPVRIFSLIPRIPFRGPDQCANSVPATISAAISRLDFGIALWPAAPGDWRAFLSTPQFLGLPDPRQRPYSAPGIADTDSSAPSLTRSVRPKT